MTDTTTTYHVGERVLLHRSETPELAYINSLIPRETGTELVLRTVSPDGQQGQVVNIFAPTDGTSWVSVPDDAPLSVAGAA